MKNPVSVARKCIGISRYAFLEENAHPPNVVNCYIFVGWVYTQCGIVLPETLAGQLYAGAPIEFSNTLKDGDLIFRGDSHWGAYYDDDRAVEGVGHVGILTAAQTVIHASWKQGTVIEEIVEKFLANGSNNSRFRGMYRIMKGGEENASTTHNNC